jgi:RNA polymerase sigma factor (sigma-70 family)
MYNQNLNEENIEIICPFEMDYQDVKHNTNFLWFKYDEKIRRIISGLSYWKNFDSEELVQQSYIYFVELCKVYDPYYNGNFIPFDKFLFKNLIIKLRAYIQRYYFKRKREQPTEFSEYMSRYGSENNVLEIDDKMYMEFLYSLITERQTQILDLSLKGYKQQEIGEILEISQSRVSVIKKKTLTKLNDILENKGKIKKKSKRL